MGSIARWLASVCTGLALLALAQPAVAAGQTCPGVTLTSPAGKLSFRLFMSTQFSWSREPRGTAGREVVLVGLDGKHSGSSRAAALSQKLNVHPGRYSWFVVFHDKAGGILCTSPLGSFSIPVPMTPDSASTSRKAPKVTVTVHGRYIVVLIGSPYAGRHDLVVNSENFDGGKFKLPKGYSGLEIRGTDNVNILIGSAKSDKIYGYGERDRIKGGKGNDIIYGGNESCVGQGCAAAFTLGDDIDGGDGDDVIYGGNESCRGDNCATAAQLGDTIKGGEGNDVIVGGNESCTGEGCAIAGHIGDVIDGGSGDDTISGGNESCNGNSCGVFASVGDTISGGSGADTIAGGNESCSGDQCGDFAQQVGDSIDTADGEIDHVDAGGGNNAVTADDDDDVTP